MVNRISLGTFVCGEGLKLHVNSLYKDHRNLLIQPIKLNPILGITIILQCHLFNTFVPIYKYSRKTFPVF